MARPTASTSTAGDAAADEIARAFAAHLEDALDAGDAAAFDDGFTRDVLWGSPFGGIVEGHDAIASIHAGMIRPASEPVRAEERGGAGDAPTDVDGSRYEVVRVRRIADDVVLAFVRRLCRAGPPDTSPGVGAAGDFDELALFVLVRRDGGWWLAAGQHVPDRRAEVYGEAVAP